MLDRNKTVAFCLALVGLINILPLVGVISSAQLQSAYSIVIGSADLEILMRHRALLFGCVGGYVLLSVVKKEHQATSMIMAGVSMLGFVAIAHDVGGFNPAIARVLIADYVGIGFLALATLLKLRPVA